MLLAQLSMPLSPATLLPNMLCHGEAVRLWLVCQPLITYNLPFFSMSWKVLLLFSKCSAAHHNDKTETAKHLRSQRSFISSQHHATEESRLVSLHRDQWKHDSLWLEPQDCFLCFIGFAVLKNPNNKLQGCRIRPLLFSSNKLRVDAQNQ